MNQGQPVVAETIDPLDTWLRQIVTEGNWSIEQVAHVMAEDGYLEHHAAIFAAVAWLRYSSVSTVELLEQEPLRHALAYCRKHLGPALEEFHGVRAERSIAPLRDPASLGNRIVLAGCPVRVHCVSRHPRLALLGGVLSASECTALIELARSKLRDSEVTPQATARSTVDRYTRSSLDTFLTRGETEIQRRIEARVSELVGLPITHCEDMSVIHYPVGGEFLPHVDFLESGATGKRVFGSEGDRIATVVLYLNNVEGGGATSLPGLGLELTAQAGSALYLTYQQPDGSPDPASLHAGKPVTDGEKWIATFWFHERPCPANMNA